MKVFTFVSLLVLALGSISVRAADSGTHTVNLQLTPPPMILEVTGTAFNSTSDINFDRDKLYRFAVTGDYYYISKELGDITIVGSHIPSKNSHCSLSFTSNNNWELISEYNYNQRYYLYVHGYTDFGSSYATSFSRAFGTDNPYDQNWPVLDAISSSGGSTGICNIKAFLRLYTAFPININPRPKAGLYQDQINFLITVL